MSKTTESATAKSKPAAPRAEVGPAMFGRDIFVEALEREGVEVIFAYPGGASMESHSRSPGRKSAPSSRATNKADHLPPRVMRA